MNMIADDCAFVVLDYHSSSIQVCVVSERGGLLGTRSVPNDGEAVRDCVDRFAGGREIRGVAIEACCAASKFMDSADGIARLAVVHGPDGAGHSPFQSQAPLFPCIISVQDLRQLLAQFRTTQLLLELLVLRQQSLPFCFQHALIRLLLGSSQRTRLQQLQRLLQPLAASPMELRFAERQFLAGFGDRQLAAEGFQKHTQTVLGSRRSRQRVDMARHQRFSTHSLAVFSRLP